MKNIKEICAVPGIDIAFIGPGDLATDMGLVRQHGMPACWGVPEFKEAEKEIAEACKASGVVAGYWSSDLKAKGELGFRFFVVNADIHAMQAALATQLAEKRAAAAAVGEAPEAESDLCQKCRTSIGHDQTEFACRQCNYFVCEHCRTQHVDELAEMTIPKLKSILVTEYGKLSDAGLDKKLTMILNGYGMKKYADIVNEGRATLPQIIQSDNYFLTNIDIWIIAVYFKIPIAFISQSLLSENGKNVMVLYGDHMTDSYFYVHPFSVTQDVPSRFGLIEVKLAPDNSVLKLPLEFVSPDLREIIRDDESESLEEYIRAFKLGNIKHKSRVFTMAAPAAGPPAEPPVAAAADIGKLASLFK